MGIVNSIWLLITIQRTIVKLWLPVLSNMIKRIFKSEAWK